MQRLVTNVLAPPEGELLAPIGQPEGGDTGEKSRRERGAVARCAVSCPSLETLARQTDSAGAVMSTASPRQDAVQVRRVTLEPATAMVSG